MYALVDGNNFYVSCERVFRPSLDGRPVVVLSNNDGCAIARSNEAKALEITVGDTSTYRAFPLIEMQHWPWYLLIDESFIGLQGVRGDLTKRSRAIRERIDRWVGIPCGIGIGSTKTLAKLANYIAKTAERKPGSYPDELAQVCNLTILPQQDLDEVLAATLVEEVWGVGRRIAAQLHEGGVHTVLDLVRMDPATVRRRWSVVLERTVRELQGMQCIDLDDAPAPKKEIACTRSFGQAITELPPLIEAVSEFASRAAEKLRKQGSLASQLLVFAHTSPFRPGPRFNRSVVVPLRRPTADTGQLVWAAAAGMRRMYEPGYRMAKAGVMLLDLVPGSEQQAELDLEDEDQRDRTKLMVALDALNGRYGKGTVHSASTGGSSKGGKDWMMRQERRTPQYTTCWADVPIARA